MQDGPFVRRLLGAAQGGELQGLLRDLLFLLPREPSSSNDLIGAISDDFVVLAIDDGGFGHEFWRLAAGSPRRGDHGLDLCLEVARPLIAS